MPTDDVTAIPRELRDKLPDLSPHAEEILRACESTDIDATTLAAMLAESPTIAARLLGLANSSFYSRGKPVYALSKAIQTLGLVTVRGIAVGFVVGGQFSPAQCPAFDAARFWESAVLSAQLAQQLALEVPADRSLESEAAYMAGLLHNIGLLALASLLPDVLNALLAARSTEAAPLPLSEQLRARTGFDHHVVAAWLADAWRLPVPMCRALEHYGERNYHADGWPLVLLTGLCARSARAIVEENDNPDRQMYDETDTLTSLGLDEGKLAHAVERVRKTVDTLRVTAEALNVHGT